MPASRFAGPAVQITVSMLALWAMGVHPLASGSSATSDAALRLWWAGPVIGLFNLLPILPFDGGHIVQAGLETVLGKRAKVVMLYFSLAITIGGGLWLLSNPRIGAIAIYAAIFPLMAQFQMLRGLRESGQPSGLEAAMRAETSAWQKGDVTLMLPGQVPSPWYRANQQLQQTSPEMARAVLLDDFADPRPPRLVAARRSRRPDPGHVGRLLPRPLPTGNPHAEQVLGDILLRLGQFDAAAHYAAESYQRSAIADLGVHRRSQRCRVG